MVHIKLITGNGILGLNRNNGYFIAINLGHMYFFII